tara:strand:- start:753 stop:1253 length:501 start_codon:yes stop_codon:yes gene_type:complete
MEKYISKKVVHAEEMTSSKWQEIRSGFEKYSDATLELDIEGYHVVYDLGKGSEYHSWAPKGNFELGNVKAGTLDYGINHDENVVDVVFGDGLTGVQSLAYDEQGDGMFSMAGIVICRDGKHNKPFGINEAKDTYLSEKEKVFIRADNKQSLQVIIDRLEEAKAFIQ